MVKRRVNLGTGSIYTSLTFGQLILECENLLLLSCSKLPWVPECFSLRVTELSSEAIQYFALYASHHR